MELSRAREFYCLDINDSGNVYRSKDLQTLMDLMDGELYNIYASIETKDGYKLFEVDWNSMEEIVIRDYGVLVHTAFITSYYKNRIKDV